MSPDVKAFQNPSGYWKHQGAFSVELTDDALISIVPSSAVVDGNKVIVREGHIQQTIGGIQFYSHEQPFSWGYSKIKEIRDGDENLLWINRNYR